MSFTSGDCKELLAQDPQAKALGANAEGWKRTGKKSLPGGEKGSSLREFFDGEGLWALVAEDTGVLSIKGYAISKSALALFATRTLGGALESIGATDSGAKNASAPDTVANREHESPSEKAAKQILDYWLALGGQTPRHSGESGIGRKSWARLVEETEESRIDLMGALSPVMELAVSTPAGVGLVAQGIKWCFSYDSDFLQKSGHWDEEGAGFLAAPKAVPDDFDLEYLVMPFHYMSGFEEVSESDFLFLRTNAATGKQAMIEAFDALTRAGFEFDKKMQKDFGKDRDYDEKHPMHVKLATFIPALMAEKEAKSLARVVKSANAGESEVQQEPRPTAKTRL